MKRYAIPVSETLSLPCIEWLSQQDFTKGKIVFLHGFANHAGNYNYLGEWFSKQGYDFLAYDHRDHGASPLRNTPCSIEDMVSDAREVIKFAYQASAHNKVLLMGSSMGGALSILASQGETQAMLSGLVLWAPQVVSTKRRSIIYKFLSGAVKIFPDLKLPTGKVAISNMPKQCDNKELTDCMIKDELMLRNPSLSLFHRVLSMGDLAAKAEFDEGFPLLILFGGKDTLIFRHDIKMFVNRIEKSHASIRYNFYPDNRHMLWGETNREVIYRDTLNWFECLSTYNDWIAEKP